MSGYAKLSSSIILSTVWREPNHIRIVWITMLALADATGYVAASLPGLADAARVSLDECKEALDCFARPDHYSRSSAHEGRRIEAVEGGWVLLNYEAYRAGRDTESRRRQNREAQARWRERKTGDGVSQSKPRKPSSAEPKPPSAHAEADAEADAEAREGDAGAPPATQPPKAPKPKKWRRVRQDFQPTAKHRQLAHERAVDLELEVEKFKNHEYDRPKSDEDAAFSSWLLRAYPSHNGSERSSRSPRVTYDTGLDEYERQMVVAFGPDRSKWPATL